MAQWRDDKLAELARQLTYSPADKRAEQMANAAALIADIDPTKEYPWEFILYRITAYRPKGPVDHAIRGEVLRADLAVLVEFLSETLSLQSAEAPEPVLLLEEVMKQFSVSSKTIQRWRRQGLVAYRFVFPDGRRRLGFLPTAVRSFASRNADRVQRSAMFRQLSDGEKELIIRYAQRMSERCHCCLKQISERIAAKMKRSPETIRYTIRKHDREHPEQAIFPEAAGGVEGIRAVDRKTIVGYFDRGIPVKTIARRYCRTRSSIVRVVSQERAQKVKSLEIEFVPNALFALPDADNIVLDVLPAEAREAVAARRAELAAATEMRPAPAGEAMPLVTRQPRDLPGYLHDYFRHEPLEQPIETDLFRRMNYLKYRAKMMQDRLDVNRAAPDEVAQIEEHLEEAREIKNTLVQANLRVAVHVARKHLALGGWRTRAGDLQELVSDATIWLMRAVDLFDFSRGVKFATYASYAIARNFARDRVEQIARPDKHMVTGQEEMLAQVGQRAGEDAVAEELDAQAANRRLKQALAKLPSRERELVIAHFGLDPARPPMSLAELGEKLKLTKTRVRQLEARALKRMREMLVA